MRVVILQPCLGAAQGEVGIGSQWLARLLPIIIIALIVHHFVLEPQGYFIKLSV